MEISQNMNLNNEEEAFDVIINRMDYRVAADYNFSDPILNPIILSNKLQITTHKNNLIGLSAPQVGISTRVFYIKGFEHAIFNPRLIDASDKQTYMDEISSSFPSLLVKIKRPEIIKIRYANAYGEISTHVYNGITARVIQRKLDFLNGVMFTKHATKYHRDQAIKKAMKNGK